MKLNSRRKRTAGQPAKLTVRRYRGVVVFDVKGVAEFKL